MKYTLYTIIGTLALAVLLPGIALGAVAPDLDVVALESSATGTVGESMTVSVYIKNNGDTTAQSSQAELRLSGPASRTLSTSLPSLSSGVTKVVRINWTPSSAGTYNAVGCADATNVVSESNESNNCSTESHSISISQSTQEQKNVNLNINDSNINEGDSVTLSWNTTGVSSCSASGGWSGSKATSGSQTVGPLFSSQSFTLSCDGVSDSAFITVNETTSTDFSADLRVAQNGFSWLQSFSGTAPLNGIDLRADITADTVKPVDFVFYCDRSDSGTQITNGWDARFNGLSSTRKNVFDVCNYQSAGNFTAKLIAVRDNVAHEDRATIIVESSNTGGGTQPSFSHFTASPSVIDKDETSLLSWKVNNADRCFASGGWSGSKNTSGNRTVFPNRDADYILTCENDAGSTEREVTVRVDDDADDIDITFRAEPSSITRGESTVLIWDADNADRCVASGGWSGTKHTSGSQTVRPNNSTTYRLSCAGDGDFDTASRRVRVSGTTTTPRPGFNLFCSANPERILLGQQTVFSAQQSGGEQPVQFSWSGLVSGSGSSQVVRPARTGVQAATVTATDDDGRQRSTTCFVSVQGAGPASSSPPPTEAPDRLTFGGFTIPAFPQDSSQSQQEESGFSLTASIFGGLGSLLFWLFIILLNILLIMALVYLWRRTEEEGERNARLREQRYR